MVHGLPVSDHQPLPAHLPPLLPGSQPVWFGGAGGVGFSGSGKAPPGQGKKIGGDNTGAPVAGGKSAGQILRMKTAPQLKKAIGDDVAGDAFYKELRALLGRQDAKAKQELRNEASRIRMNQMRRKPELQARVQL